MAEKREDFKFEIVSNIGVIAQGNKGWKRELNRVSWNGGAPKYDIRDWDENHEKMGKGLTMTEEDLRTLKDLIDEELSSIDKPE